ncbi:MAG TPA: M20/M25/M40 family metallo-hydrolase [Gemmatimonadales bacterium]|nr:M20/M25/M40 family metallo-hydrolase [Gemmatimonadales bacterium]
MTDPLALARELVDIPSVSGEERDVAQFVGQRLTDLGYRVDMFDAAPGRPNVLATTEHAPRLVLSTHLDTVPPHLPAREDTGVLYGRGACDAKGIIAAQIAAAERLRAEGVSDIGLLFVVDEEMGSVGARAANAHPRARECRWLIDGEPTDNKLAEGSKGSLRLTLRTTGTAAHSAYPEQGRSAIDSLLEVLADLRRVAWPTDPFFGDTTLNVGVIAGGTRPNVVASDARADLQVRLVTNAEPVQRLLERTVGGRARIEYLTAVNPMRLTTVPGCETCVVRFTTDIPHLTNWGRPLLLGPGSILDAHTEHERISAAELVAGVQAYVRLVRALLRERVVA